MLKKIFPKSTKFIYSFMLKNKKYLFAFILLGMLNIFLDIIEPFFAKNIIDKALKLINLSEIKYMGLFWIAIFFAKYFVRFISKKINLKFLIDTLIKIQASIFKHVLTLPISYFKQNSVGYIMSRQIDDVYNLDGLMLNNVVDGVLSFIEIAIILFIMSKISILLTMISVLIICLDILNNFSFPLKKLYKDHNEAKANINKELQDVLFGINLIKISNSIQYEEKRFIKILKNYYLKREIRDKIDIIRRTFSGFITEFSVPLIIITGGIFVYKNLITVGEVMAFILYFQRLNTVYISAVYMIPLFRISQASAERIYELFNTPPEMSVLSFSETKNKISINDSIEFKNVFFSYDKKNILNDINMKIYSKKINAIIGKSGSGKSTLVNLLLRLYIENNGEILIDGKNINNYELNLLRNSIAFLSQEAILFNRSMFENISYNLKENANTTDITDAIDKAYATSIINNLPNKLNTIIGDRGNTISGGEKQRICIAREILKNSDLFIFDESVSALDSISEEIIQKTINELAKTKTIIIITHRLSTIKNANIIYVLDNGTVFESGSHADLLNKKGLYYSLYLKQQDKIHNTKR